MQRNFNWTNKRKRKHIEECSDESQEAALEKKTRKKTKSRSTVKIGKAVHTKDGKLVDDVLLISI